MGRIRAPRRGRSVRRATGALLVASALAACAQEGATATGVGPADAIVAVVEWQAGEQETIVGDNGKPQLPVIFLVADDSATIGVGVQAEVAEATVDVATVRFADDIADTFDTNVVGEPVRKHGSMFVLGPIPEPATTIELNVVRYTSIDSAEPMILEISSETPSGDTTDDGSADLTASVTAVTRP